MPNALALSDARQPRYAVGVARGNQLAHGLIAAVHWQHRGTYNPALRRGGVTLGPTSGAAAFSVARRHGLQGIAVSSASVSPEWTICSNLDVGTAGTTVYVLSRPLDTTLNTATLFGVYDGSTLSRRCGVHAPFDTGGGTVLWDYGGASGGTTRLSWVSGNIKNVNKIDRWCFVAATRGREIWLDGILRASNTTAASRTAAADEKFVLFNGQNASVGSTSDPMAIYLALVWNRGLSRGEVLQIDHNPWQVFAASDIQRSFVPAAAAGAGGGRLVQGSLVHGNLVRGSLVQ